MIMSQIDENAVPNAVEPHFPVGGGAAEIAFRRIARRKLIERGYNGDDAIEAKITELLHKGLPIDPKVLVE